MAAGAFGDAVAIASAVERSSVVGCVQVSAEAWALLPPAQKALFTPRGAVGNVGEQQVFAYIWAPRASIRKTF